MQSPPFIQSNQENHSKASYLGLAVRVGGGVRVARETVYWDGGVGDWERE